MENKIKVTLDPGHYKNYNRGAITTYYESNVMYDLALTLKAELERYGIFEVFVTKSNLDSNPSLDARGKAAINNKSRVFLSLHTNAASDSSAYRTEIYNSVKRPGSEEFAQEMINAIVTTLRNHGQGKEPNRVNSRKNSSGTDYYGVMRSAASSDGVQHILLIEHDFHTNLKACQIMSEDSFWEDAAATMAKVVFDNMSKYYIGPSVKTYSCKTTTGVNVRAEPSTSALKLGTLAANQGIKVVSKVSGWYKFIWNGCAAWVSSQYVDARGLSIPDDDKVNFQIPGAQYPPSAGLAGDISAEGENNFTKYYIKPAITVDMTGKVNCSALNVRSGPGTSFKKIDCLSSGDIVGVYPRDTIPPGIEDPMKGWLYISYKGNSNTLMEGFVCDDYIDLTIKTTPKAKVCSTNGLNYRVGPSTTAKKVGALENGTIVYTLGTSSEDKDWMKIRLSEADSNIYYVSAKYLTEIIDEGLSTTVSNGTFIESYQDCDYAKVTSNVTVRSIPSTNGATLGTAKAGSILCVTSTINDKYARIMWNDVYAYVIMRSITLIPRRKEEILKVNVPAAIATFVQELPESSCADWFIKTLGARISSPFGPRTHPITSKQTMHTGIDFAAPGGTPIYCNVDGIVIYAGYDNSCGNMLRMLDEFGREHRFYHMKSASTKKAGDYVSVGEIVGYVGSTGDSTGNHLHYEIRMAPWGSANVIDPNSISFQ